MSTSKNQAMGYCSAGHMIPTDPREFEQARLRKCPACQRTINRIRLAQEQHKPSHPSPEAA